MRDGLRAVEIFSGAGGLALGLAQAGVEHALLVERDAGAARTLRQNFPGVEVLEQDIRGVDLSPFAGADLLAGGPPCQPFSLGGQHRGQEDARDLFPEAARAILQIRPRAFLFENVRGLLRASFRDYFTYTLARLERPHLAPRDGEAWQAHAARLSASHEPAAYRLSFLLLNAADFGVAQHRERVFIVGLRADQPGAWAFPAPTHCRERLCWDLSGGAYARRHRLSPDQLQHPDPGAPQMFPPPGLPWRTIRDATADLPDPQSAHGREDHRFQGGARAYKGHEGSDLDWPAKTIKAGDHGVPGGENMIRFADGSVRYLTVLETKRVQGFPDDFRIAGAWGERMRQLGNAVPVPLAEALGRRLVQTLQRDASPIRYQGSAEYPASGTAADTAAAVAAADP